MCFLFFLVLPCSLIHSSLLAGLPPTQLGIKLGKTEKTENTLGLQSFLRCQTQNNRKHTWFCSLLALPSAIFQPRCIQKTQGEQVWSFCRPRKTWKYNAQREQKSAKGCNFVILLYDCLCHFLGNYVTFYVILLPFYVILLLFYVIFRFPELND